MSVNKTDVDANGGSDAHVNSGSDAHVNGDVNGGTDIRANGGSNAEQEDNLPEPEEDVGVEIVYEEEEPIEEEEEEEDETPPPRDNPVEEDTGGIPLKKKKRSFLSGIKMGLKRSFNKRPKKIQRKNEKPVDRKDDVQGNVPEPRPKEP
eukprot:1541543-Ditylum_brightwellii.AAC.1